MVNKADMNVNKLGESRYLEAHEKKSPVTWLSKNMNTKGTVSTQQLKRMSVKERLMSKKGC